MKFRHFFSLIFFLFSFLNLLANHSLSCRWLVLTPCSFSLHRLHIVETVDLLLEQEQSIEMFMSPMGGLWFEHQTEVWGLVLKTPLSVLRFWTSYVQVFLISAALAFN